MTMSADGTDRHLVYRRSSLFQPAWSPDGTQIAVAGGVRRLGGTRIFVVNVDGSGAEPITYAGAWEPEWSPDGSRIAYTSYPAGVGVITTVAPDGSDPVVVTPEDLYSRSPSWSPDGSRLAFVAGNFLGPTTGIYTVAADGSDVVAVTNGVSREGSPAWAPDGTVIAFTRPRPDDRGLDVWMADPDGSNVVRITDTLRASERRLSWQST